MIFIFIHKAKLWDFILLILYTSFVQLTRVLLVSHNFPEYPYRQEQLNFVFTFDGEHSPLCWQGDDSHGSKIGLFRIKYQNVIILLILNLPSSITFIPNVN